MEAKNLTRDQISILLRGGVLFAGMSCETEKLLLALPVQRFTAGEMISGDGILTPRLGVLLSGKAAIWGRGGGGRVLLNRIVRGDVFGAAGVFFPEPEAVSTTVAVSKCEILFIERELLERIIRNDFAVAMAYIELLSCKVRFLNRKIIDFTAGRADAALAGYLLSHADGDGRLSVNMTRLACSLDIGRTTLYRAVNMLTEIGAIVYDGREIRICDREALEQYRL